MLVEMYAELFWGEMTEVLDVSKYYRVRKVRQR